MTAGDQPTGEQLYQELRTEAARRRVSLHSLGALLFPNGPGWKLEQMRIAAAPKPETVARVRALIAGQLPPLPDTITRQAREAAGLPASKRQVQEERVLDWRLREKADVEHRLNLSRQAHDLRRPGETLHAAAARLATECRT